MEIIGHQKQWQFFKKVAESGRFSHAYLFSGPEKIGKRTIALEFVKLICGQDALAREHPDLIFITPAQREIQISQIRELSWKLSLKPYSAPLKVAIIDKAHCLNQEAQNSLLKTLEEPKGRTLLILITETPEVLFSTILSRCEIIKFYPVENSEIEKYLKKQGIEKLRLAEIINSAAGKPGAAIDFFQNPQKLEAQNKLKEKLTKIIQADFFLRFQYAKALSEDSANLKEVLEVWLGFLREALISKIKGKESLKDYSIPQLKSALERIQTTNYLISTTNINPRLALEVLLMAL